MRFVAVTVGFILLEFGKDRRMQLYGQILLGFGVMFMGRELMAETVKPIAAHLMVAVWLEAMGRAPLLGVLAGVILTSIIQSSTATTGLLIAMGAAGVITLPAAIGFIYGANIGSCIMGLLASLRSSAAGRRASAAQITINVIGVLLFLPFIMPYASLLQRTSTDLARQIANAHSIFNIVVSVILLPFIKPLTAFTRVLVPEKKETEQERVTQFIDDQARGVSSVAIRQASLELDRMGATALRMLEMSRQALINREEQTAQEVLNLERQVCDPLCDAIERFVDSVILEGGSTR